MAGGIKRDWELTKNKLARYKEADGVGVCSRWHSRSSACYEMFEKEKQVLVDMSKKACDRWVRKHAIITMRRSMSLSSMLQLQRSMLT